MPRDSSGNYTLPAGNPVVTGSTIASSWANTTLNDIATEMTDSLDRSGKGAMLAPLKILDGAVGAPGLAFGSESSTGIYRIGAGEVGIATLGGLRIQIGPSGQVIVYAAASGTTLDVQSSATASSPTLRVQAVAAASSGAIEVYDSTNAVIRGYMGGGGLITGQGVADFGIAAATGNFLIGRQGGAAIAVSVNSAGNVIVNAPSSGITTSITGAANSAALHVVGSSTTSQSFGVEILAGTNSSDRILGAFNQAGSTLYFSVLGTGAVFGNDGTSQFELGYKDVPTNSPGTSYTLLISDRGKGIGVTNGTTITVPSGVFTAGATIVLWSGSGNVGTIAQGSGLTLEWAGNGGTTGNRTLTGAGLATIYYVSGSIAFISGAGLS